MAHHRLWALLVLVSTCAFAQWLNYQTPGVPRTPDGKPDLTAPVPRTADGRPDLSGVWMHEYTSVEEMKRLYGALIDTAEKVDVPGMEIGTVHKYLFNILADFKPEEAPIRPAGVEAMRRRNANSNPAKVCSNVPGLPVVDLVSEPMKIVQAPRLTILLYEAGSLHRQVYTDGRGLPKEFDFPAFLGYSVGHWEGDTLVVETAGYNDQTVMDAMGHSHSEALHMTERFRRRDFGHLDLEYTFDDPVMYTKPFTIKVPHNLLADGDIFESFCENERDSRHIQAATDSGKK